MAAPVKALVLGAGVVGVGGVGIWLTVMGGIPEPRTLDKDAGFSGESSQYKGKYAEDYARFLVGTGSAADGAQPTDNSSWWEWSFRNNFGESDALGGFKAVDKGAKASTPDDKSLQEACDKAYKAAKTNVVSTDPAEQETDKFKEDQLWRYCGFVSAKPKLLKDAETEKIEEDTSELKATSGKWSGDKLGSKHKDHLLSIHHPNNEAVWEHLNRIFKATEGITGFFASNGDDVKGKCEAAYAKDSVSSNGDASKPKEADLYTWCSLKGTKTAAA